jgi:hypothetical protein
MVYASGVIVIVASCVFVITSAGDPSERCCRDRLLLRDAVQEAAYRLEEGEIERVIELLDQVAEETQ